MGAITGLLLLGLLNILMFYWRRIYYFKLKGRYIAREKYKPHKVLYIIELSFKNCTSNIISVKSDYVGELNVKPYTGEILMSKELKNYGRCSYRHEQSESGRLIGFGESTIDITNKDTVLVVSSFSKKDDEHHIPQIWQKIKSKDVDRKLTTDKLIEKYRNENTSI